MHLLDDDKRRVSEGDRVRFNYGIPPVRVVAEVILREGKLVALTPGHTPKEVNLRALRKYVGAWFRE